MVGPPDWWTKRKAVRDGVSFFRKWPFALILGTVLGLLALIDKGNLSTDSGPSPIDHGVVHQSPAGARAGQHHRQAADHTQGDRHLHLGAAYRIDVAHFCGRAIYAGHSAAGSPRAGRTRRGLA